MRGEGREGTPSLWRGDEKPESHLECLILKDSWKLRLKAKRHC